MLRQRWSPHAVAADLRNEGSLSLVCAETIYQACYEPCGARGYRAAAGDGSHAAAVNRQNAAHSVTSDPSLTVPQPRRTVANPATR